MTTSATVEVVLAAASPRAGEGARKVLSTVRDLIRGQSLDIELEQRDGVTTDEYFAMTGGKTASLISCAVSLGAVLGEAPGHVVRGSSPTAHISGWRSS